MFFTNVKRNVPVGSPLGTGERYQPLYNLKTRLSPCDETNTYINPELMYYPFEGFLFYRMSKFIDASFDSPTASTWDLWYNKIWDLDLFLDFVTPRDTSWGIKDHHDYEHYQNGKWRDWVEKIEPYTRYVGPFYYVNYDEGQTYWNPRNTWPWWTNGQYPTFAAFKDNVYSSFYGLAADLELKREYDRNPSDVKPMPIVQNWGEYAANYKGFAFTFGRPEYFYTFPPYDGLDPLPYDNQVDLPVEKVMPNLEEGLFLWAENQPDFSFTEEETYNVNNPLTLDEYDTKLLTGRFAYLKIGHTYVYEQQMTDNIRVRTHFTFRAIDYPRCCIENRSIYLEPPEVGSAYLTIDLVIDTFRHNRLINTEEWPDLFRCDPIVWNASSSMTNKYEHVLRPDKDMGLIDKPYIYQDVENPLVLDYYPFIDNEMTQLYVNIKGVDYAIHAGEYRIVDESILELTEQRTLEVTQQPAIVLDQESNIHTGNELFTMLRSEQPNIGDSKMPICVKMERFVRQENTITTTEAYFYEGKLRIDIKPVLLNLIPQQYIRFRLLSGKYCYMDGHVITRPKDSYQEGLQLLYKEMLEFYRSYYDREDHNYEEQALDDGRLNYVD